jgi:hypothetical protein
LQREEPPSIFSLFPIWIMNMNHFKPH